MYEAYFSFSGSPFRLAPDPKFFFGSKSHNKAMAYLHYGLRQAEGFIVITGEIGAGKSVLIGHLLDQLDRSNVLAANLLTPNLAPDQLLSHVLSAFRIEAAGAGKTADIEALEDFLFDQMNHGRRVLLVVDEAQSLPLATLEELRILSNLNYDGTPLFQVFLVGQPDFRDTMARGDLEQLRQRVIATYHLEPMTREETEKYIEHRLAGVGWGGDPKIAADAYDAIFAATGGLPRKIHKLCNRVLLHCSVEKRHEVTEETVNSVLADLSAEQATPPREEAPVATDAPHAPEPVAAPHAATGVIGDVAPAEPANEFAVAQPAAASVFDRLRRGKSEAPLTDEDGSRPPKLATLDDVANAIAAARPSRFGFGGADLGDLDAVTDKDDCSTPGGPLESLGDGEAWRSSVVKSINDTRDELKRAHGSVGRLRRQLTEIDRRRRKRRVQIAASLDRAESLLVEFQNAWR